MTKFVGRKRELAELNRILSQRGAQFILVYGRRRVGKTTLLLNWAERSGRPFIYWVANRDTPAQVRLGFTRAVWRWAHPEIVGSHWATDAQVDVVAVNWHDQAILLGECKWGVDALARPVIREFIDKTPKVLPGEGWQVFYAYFSRAGFTDAARQEAQAMDALLVDLDTLDKELSGA